MLSPKTIYILRKLLPYLILVLVAGLLYALLERGIMGEAKIYPSTGNHYDFMGSLLGVLPVGVVGGILLGLLEEVFFKNFLFTKSFILRMLTKTFLYVSLIGTLLVVNSIFNSSYNLDIPFFDRRNIPSMVSFVTDFAFISVIIYATVFIAVALYVSETLNRMGRNAIASFFTGRYTTPKEEERIFMFLDMRSSTTIAEKLGHKKYYRLLNEYYRDMTNAIINTYGTIYQYVGDEIVLSWRMEKGLKNANCIRCFFLIQKTMASRRSHYEEKYGLVPGFKAGVHYGRVTTGEIGEIKKEILFTGDVLNTTARIQGLCNTLKTNLLISGELQEKLPPQTQFKAVSKGKFELKGRDQMVELFSVKQA